MYKIKYKNNRNELIIIKLRIYSCIELIFYISIIIILYFLMLYTPKGVPLSAGKIHTNFSKYSYSDWIFFLAPLIFLGYPLLKSLFEILIGNKYCFNRLDGRITRNNNQIGLLNEINKIIIKNEKYELNKTNIIKLNQKYMIEINLTKNKYKLIKTNNINDINEIVNYIINISNAKIENQSNIIIPIK